MDLWILYAYNVIAHRCNVKTAMDSCTKAQDAKGWPEGGWFPEQRMTIEEAIKGFTIWAAYSSFQEDVLGSIEKGKYADFTVLDKDILGIEPKELLTTKAVYTSVGGKICYRK